jgi:hypothetical protein
MLRDFLMVLQKVDGTAPVREDWEWAMVILADYSFNQYDPKVCGKVAKTRTEMLAYLGIDAGEFNAVVKSAATKLTHHNFGVILIERVISQNDHGPFPVLTHWCCAVHLLQHHQKVAQHACLTHMPPQ